MASYGAAPRSGPRAPRRSEQGIVLALVLVLALLLSAALVTFVRRAMIDSIIVRNRDAAAQAEALARGGLRVAVGLLVQSASADFGLGDPADGNLSGLGGNAQQSGQQGQALPMTDTLDAPWALLEQVTLPVDGGTLNVRIQDQGARLNINALVRYDSGAALPGKNAEEFLVEFFGKVIEEMRIDPGEKLYEPRELAQNLLDWVDADDLRLGAGGDEDSYYQQQDPPYHAANRPFLSVEELGMVEGFDEQLVAALRPYLTVFPLVGGTGINLNTAPPHVLSAVYHGTSGDMSLADEETVRRVLETRQEGRLLCTERALDERCELASDLVRGIQYPGVSLPSTSSVYTVVSKATMGDTHRTVEAVVDRSDTGGARLLFWRLY